MWSHGYNYYDRDRDRQYIMNNALKDSDPEVGELLWCVCMCFIMRREECLRLDACPDL